jgi:hypothetical protein
MVGPIRGFTSLVAKRKSWHHDTLLYSQTGAGFINPWRTNEESFGWCNKNC